MRYSKQMAHLVAVVLFYLWITCIDRSLGAVSSAQIIDAEEGLTRALMAAKTEEERKSLVEKTPELLTPALARSLDRLCASVCVDQGSFQQALSINQFLYSQAERSDHRLLMASVSLNIGNILYNPGNPERSPERALESYRTSLQIGEAHGFKDIAGRALLYSAITLHSLGERGQAAEYYQKGLELCDEQVDHDLGAKAWNNLGVIHRSKGSYLKALRCFLKSLRIREKNLNSGADWSGLGVTRNNLGSLFELQGNDERALAYYQQALEAAEKAIRFGNQKAQGDVALALEAMGNLYLICGKTITRWPWITFREA